MLTYNDLYELTRKEKYAEQLQQLPSGFIDSVSSFLQEQRGQTTDAPESLLDGSGRSKKQLENSIALFKELILRRKKKLLTLVFVAAETGIMKRDYENMLSFEKIMFDSLAKTFEDGDKALFKELQGIKNQVGSGQSMIMFSQATSQFVDMAGNLVGPFNAGELANLDSSVSSILVSSGKATYVDA